MSSIDSFPQRLQSLEEAPALFQAPLAVLKIELRAGGGGTQELPATPVDVVRVRLPQEIKGEVAKFLEQMTRQLPQTGHSAA